MKDLNGVSVDPALYLMKEVAEAVSTPGKITVLADVLNIRLGPGLDGADRGDVRCGDTIEKAGEPIEKDGIRWVPVRVWVAEGKDGNTYLN